MDSGVAVDIIGVDDVGGSSGGGGSAIDERAALPPFTAADLEGLQLEAWLLEVSFEVYVVGFVEFFLFLSKPRSSPICL